MRSVSAAGRQGIACKSQPWRVKEADFFTQSEQLRALCARLVNTTAENIALIPSASYGIAVAARNLPVSAAQNLVLLADQFPSNVYAWKQLARQTGARLITVARPANGDCSVRLLETITANTAVVAVPHCHWTDGGLINVERIGQRCRESGAALVLDVSQSAGALPIDVQQTQPDYLICVGYKWLLGPYSMGFLYCAPQHHEGEPLEHNWIARANSEDFSNLVNYRDDYQPGARRFDVGERSNFILVPMLHAALSQVLDWGVDEIQTTLRARTRSIAARAAELGLYACAESVRAGHFLGLDSEPWSASRLLPRLIQHNVFVSVRGNTMRITPHIYNTDADIDRLFTALEEAVAARPYGCRH